MTILTVEDWFQLPKEDRPAGCLLRHGINSGTITGYWFVPFGDGMLLSDVHVDDGTVKSVQPSGGFLIDEILWRRARKWLHASCIVVSPVMFS